LQRSQSGKKQPQLLLLALVLLPKLPALARLVFRSFAGPLSGKQETHPGRRQQQACCFMISWPPDQLNARSNEAQLFHKEGYMLDSQV
jgi:hypothetical protein